MEEKKRILVVDDDTSILRGFRALLEKAGYIVETAETGKEALRHLKSAKFDLCLVDVKLPDMDGTELLFEMKRILKQLKLLSLGSLLRRLGLKRLIMERTIFWLNQSGLRNCSLLFGKG